MKKIILIALLCLCFVVPALAEYPAFDLESATVTMNNGVVMPILGIGTYALSSEQAENSVYWALRDGYRLIDTARIYGNEDGVGRGIRRAIEEGYVTREEIFVTTKMWTSDFGNGDAAIDASLERLGLDYIDLMSCITPSPATMWTPIRPWNVPWRTASCGASACPITMSRRISTGW